MNDPLRELILEICKRALLDAALIGEACEADSGEKRFQNLRNEYCFSRTERFKPKDLRNELLDFIWCDRYAWICKELFHEEEESEDPRTDEYRRKVERLLRIKVIGETKEAAKTEKDN